MLSPRRRYGRRSRAFVDKLISNIAEREAKRSGMAEAKTEKRDEEREKERVTRAMRSRWRGKMATGLKKSGTRGELKDVEGAGKNKSFGVPPGLPLSLSPDLLILPLLRRLDPMPRPRTASSPPNLLAVTVDPDGSLIELTGHRSV